MNILRLFLKPFRAFDKLIEKYFTVKSSSGTTLAYLDGIRAIAVLFVLVFHCWVLSGGPRILVTIPFFNNVMEFSSLFAAGHVGVELFFVLSGFLLSQAWFKAYYQQQAPPTILKYYKQRFFRIAPAFYVCFFLMLLFFTPKYIASEAIFSSDGAFIVGSHLLFMHYLTPLASSSYINGSLWTLTHEMTFYPKSRKTPCFSYGDISDTLLPKGAKPIDSLCISI